MKPFHFSTAAERNAFARSPVARLLLAHRPLTLRERLMEGVRRERRRGWARRACRMFLGYVL